MRVYFLTAVLLFTSAGFAQHGKFVNDQYELQKVADGVYSFIAPESDSGVVQSNCTVIIGDDAVLVVDSGQFPSLAQKMVADIKQLTPKPVRYLVNTHWHFDHVWGNGVFRDAYPGLTIISTEFTRDLVNGEGPKTIKNQPDVNRKQSAESRKVAAEGKLPDGRALPDDYKASLLRLADTLDHVEAEFPLTVHTPPNLGFEKEIEIDLGHRMVKIMWLGRANTGGDAEVWVPDVKLLATGDTVVYPIPFAFGSYLSEWPDVLQKMSDLHASVIIPGHGPVMHDDSYMRTLQAICREIVAVVRANNANHTTVEELRKQLKLDEYMTQLYGDNKRKKSEFVGTFVEPGLDRALQEASGQLKPEGMDE